MREKTKVIYNNVLIDEQDSYPKKILGSMMSVFIPQLKYMSIDGMRVGILQCLDMLDEVSCGINEKARKYIYYILRTEDRNLISNMITEFFLSSEKLGCLTGFKYSSYTTAKGGKKKIADSSINPEKTSIAFI